MQYGNSVDNIGETIAAGVYRYLDAMFIGKLLVTAVIITFGLVVSIRARKDPQQVYWTNMINLWMGRNSWGVFLILFNLWFLTYLVGFLAPVIQQLERTLAAMTPHLLAGHAPRALMKV